MPFVGMKIDERNRAYFPMMARAVLAGEEFEAQVNGDVVLLYRKGESPERIVKSLRLLEAEQKLKMESGQ